MNGLSCPIEPARHHTAIVAGAAQQFIDSRDRSPVYGITTGLLDNLERRWPNGDAESEWLIAKACRNAAAQPIHLAVWLDALETCLKRPEDVIASLDPATAPRADDFAEEMWAGGRLATRNFQVNKEQLAFKRSLHNIITTSLMRTISGQSDALAFHVDLWRESFEYFSGATQSYLSFLEEKGLANCSRYERQLYENYRNAPNTVEGAFRATNATNTSSALIMLAAEQRNTPAPYTGNELFEHICSELQKHVGLLSGKRNVSNPLIPSGNLGDPEYLVGKLATSELTGLQTWASPAFVRAGERYAIEPPGDCAGWMLLHVPEHRRALVKYIRSVSNNGIINQKFPETAVRTGEIHIFIASLIAARLWGERKPFV